MRMQLDRDLNGLFQCFHKISCGIRKEQACHILDTDGVCTHLLDLFCGLGPVVQSVSITQSVGQGYLCMSVLFVGSLYCSLQVTEIVQTVKDTDDINTICDGFLYKILYHIICVGTITQNVLSTEQHLQFGVFEAITEFTKSLPWIFVKETKRCIKSSAAPALYGMVAYFIHCFYDGKHLLCGHSGGDQGLMGITQNGLSNFNRFFFDFRHY